MITEVTNILAGIGVLAVLFGLGRGLYYLWVKRPRITVKNPLKQYIRQEVINYLNQLKNEQ